MSVRAENNKKGQKVIVVDRRWPNKERFRRIMPNRTVAKRLDHRIASSIADGTWKTLRRELKFGFTSRIKLRDYCDQYLETYCKVHTKSWETARSKLRLIRQLLGGLFLEDIEAQHVDGYMAKRQRDGVKNATINREISTLKHMLKRAKRDGLLSGSPLSDVGKLRETRPERPRTPRRYLERILPYLPWPVRQIVIFIYETGCRPSEALALERQYVDLDHRTVVFNMRKAGDNALVALSTLAVEIIQEIPELPNCPYLFWNPRTRTRYKRINETFARAREKAGLPGVQLKDFRHEVGRVIAESGQPLHVAQVQLGHSSIRTTEAFYAKATPEFGVPRARKVLDERAASGPRNGRDPGGKTPRQPQRRISGQTGSSNILSFKDLKR